MDAYKAPPGFAAKLRLPEYYEAVTTTIKLHRRTITLREVAAKLNAKNLTTPAGRVWTRQNLASFIRNNNI
ncbi:hypothetical protein [Massilia sp. ST3]|uniref:hypothetical protein n=1 Tax=Massilia sp. ST3 TaxID=2824903 RepID=UPI001B8138F0|nr:hypothetical protein [Massilia sp. ST3]MBQ5946409.1 hypothetical protein [Massilia sp. ST3]